MDQTCSTQCSQTRDRRGVRDGGRRRADESEDMDGTKRKVGESTHMNGDSPSVQRYTLIPLPSAALLINHLHSPAAEEWFAISTHLPSSFPLISFCLLCQLLCPILKRYFRHSPLRLSPSPISSSHLFYITLLLLFPFFHCICT